MNAELTVPHSVEAEQAFLGALLIDPEAVHKVRGIVEPEDLYVVRHQ
jgi:replicative DNA helicase